jgi:hypothetical protein
MRVEWVHPSWRDLVIEALAADEVARRHFLSRCGVDGVAIALSFGGGVSGERERPLLRCDADWDALGDGVYALCHECGEAEAIQLLGLIDDAGEFDEVLALARLALERLGWAGQAISVDAIAAWAPLAAKLDPPPEAPAVAMTWLELEPGGAPRTPAELEAFADWVRLAVILHEHDPALLKGLGFPERHAHVLLDFADQKPLDEPPIERDLRRETLARLTVLDAPGAALARQTTEVVAVAMPFEDMLVSEEPVLPRDAFPVERVLRDLVP